MVRVDGMYLPPVKSLALTEVTRAHLDKPGIAGDRAFFIVDARGKLFTQREYGLLVKVKASYDVTTGELELAFPSACVLKGVPEPGEPLSTPFWSDRPVEGHVVRGEWNDALSEFAGQPLRLREARRGASPVA